MVFDDGGRWQGPERYPDVAKDDVERETFQRGLSDEGAKTSR
ncbi:MAG: hypothetical protein ACREXY_09805 [Gammaproteobacteria bacterium]